MPRQTMTDRNRIKAELVNEFALWVKMTDEQLLQVVHKRAPLAFQFGEGTRGDWLRFLILDRLDRIN